jgi:hypothetical protein
MALRSQVWIRVPRVGGFGTLLVQVTREQLALLDAEVKAAERKLVEAEQRAARFAPGTRVSFRETVNDDPEGRSQRTSLHYGTVVSRETAIRLNVMYAAFGKTDDVVFVLKADGTVGWSLPERLTVVPDEQAVAS